MSQGGTVLMDISPEDFAQKNGKLIQMLKALENRAPSEDELKKKGASDIQGFLDKLEHEAEEAARESEDGKVNYDELLSYGLHTRDLSDGVMKSRFYAYYESLIAKGHDLDYIHRRMVRRSTTGQRGNPNLMMNYITEKGKELLDNLP